jgi:hypothetical protein
MRLKTAIALSVVIGCAWCASNAAAQPAPCEACESCDPSPCETCDSCNPAPCGCAGHGSGCCCNGICSQAPPNPLAPGRPSPPPCCADGICYPNYETWGHYKTRWRPWPIQLAATAPGAPTAPPAARPDAPPYEVLPPEEEDRPAPRPSVTRGKPVEIAPRREAPQEGDRESAPTTPSPTAPTPPQDTSGTELPSEDLFGLPPEETGPGGTTPPASPGAPFDETPGTTPLTPPDGGESAPGAAPLGEPMGDHDLPPAPPFAASRRAAKTALPASNQRPAAAAPKRDAHAAPRDDPPPALPSALASVSR